MFKKHPLSPPKVPDTIVAALTNDSLITTLQTTLNATSTITLPYTKPPYKKEGYENMPNTALITILLVLGTFFIAFYLRKIRQSHFFSSKARRVVSDFGVPISMVVMVCLDLLLQDVFTEKIKMPTNLTPTHPDRKSFVVNPLGGKKPLHFGYIALAILPAILVVILLFMETELTGVLLNKKKNKLKKGGGYNLDLFVMGGLTMISSALGLPWMCAATVRSVQHQNALAIMSRSHAPGERPFLMEIKEQRLTNFCIHILIGKCFPFCCLLIFYFWYS